MKYNFNVAQELVENKVYWIARCKEVPTIIGQGDSPQEAIAELEENEQTWLIYAKELGIEIPECKPASARKYSGKFMTRVSPTVHAQAAAIATDEGISLNQYVSDAISYYNGLDRSGGSRSSYPTKVISADFGPVEKRI